MMRRLTYLIAGATLFLAPAPMSAQADVAAPAWRIDTSHSELTFQIRHLLSRVRGGFGEWGGTIEVDPQNLAAGSVRVEIAASTIDTNHARRDADLRGSDFFDAERHPIITFDSRSVEVGADGTIRISGDLTIRGITRPVTLEGEYLGRMNDPQRGERIGFEAEATINRHDFGITWNRVVEGGQLLGDEVRIVMSIQAVRQ